MIKPEGPQTLSTGESLVLECIAEGDPNARVVWVPPPGSSVPEVEGRGSAILRVSPVTADEAGIFTCYIYTDLGPQEKTIEIIGMRLIAVIIIIIDQLPNLFMCIFATPLEYVQYNTIQYNMWLV